VKARLAFAAGFALCVARVERARADPSCAGPVETTVLVRGGPSPEFVSVEEIARRLATGLAPSEIGVCVGEVPGSGTVAQVDVAAADGATIRIRVTDLVTSKTLERAIDLSAIPPDSRGVAVALYVEELLQASWAELALARRVYLHERPASPPAAVQRVVASVLPPRAPPRARPLRLSLGASAAAFQGGAALLGPELSIGWRARPWLEPAVRAVYRVGPAVAAPHGTIEAQAVGAGVSIDLVWPLARAASLYFPEGVDLSSITFVASARPHALATTGLRPAVVVSHGAGLRIAAGPVVTASVDARFCWTPLPAEAADDHRVVVGVSGVGGEVGVSVDARF
jgi:hypothetical protein